MSHPHTVDLVGVGPNATGTVIPLAEYTARGSKVEYTQVSVLPGGQVVSTVVACQRWGLTTRGSTSGCSWEQEHVVVPGSAITPPFPTQRGLR